MLSDLFVPRAGDARYNIRNFVDLLTRNAVAKRCVFADLYTWFIYNTLYIRLKLASSSHILTKLLDAQRRTALICATQGVDCASCMCDWGITEGNIISSDVRLECVLLLLFLVCIGELFY